jgi:hypothetical protein
MTTSAADRRPRARSISASASMRVAASETNDDLHLFVFIPQLVLEYVRVPWPPVCSVQR